MSDMTPAPQQDVLGQFGIDASGFGVGGAEAPQPLGGYLAPPNLGSPPETSRMTSGYGQFSGYFAGQEMALLQGMPTEQLVRLQNQMVALGMTSKVIPGEFDRGTIGGFEQLLAMANTRRERWQETLQRASTTAATTDMGPAKVDVYRPPDYATLAETIKATFKSKLRRDPTDAEMALMGDELSTTYRQQFDASIDAADMLDDNVGAGRVVEGPAQVDPAARFQQEFDSRYSGELQVVDNVDERQQQNAVAGSVLDSFGSLIGGGA
jgi:hypothetical protein